MLFSLILAGCDRPPQESAATDAGPWTRTAEGTATNWTSPGGAADESAYSPLGQIDAANVGRLGLAWALDLPDEVTLESTPLAIDGVLYFSGGYAEVYAVDAVSGALRWKYDPETWKRRPEKFHFGANRGIAYEDGRIFTVGMDGRVDALDAQTGALLWQAESIPDGMRNYSTGAPRTMNGKLIIGNAGADFGARGFVTAFDTATGRLLWRFFTVPGSPEENAGDPVMELAAGTWRGEWWKTGTGGTVWNGITFDPELNRIYLGVGNAGPYDPELRSPGGGDNLFTSSIVALDADTGTYAWHYQENPRDAWDYKATPNIIAATLEIDGAPRRVLMHAPTNGFFYLLDRNDGRLISAGKTTLITWAKSIDPETGRPVEEPGIRYEDGSVEIWPGTIGGHNWQAMSYSPLTGLVYIPVQQLGTRFSRHGGIGEGAVTIMGLTVESIARKPGDGKGRLVAWDPRRQQEAWSVGHEQLWNGGTLATAGNLVFQGTAEGWFNAYRASDGVRLWRFDAQLGIIAAPMSFSVADRQYVSVLVGYGGTTAALGEFMDVGWKYGAQVRRLLTFALDGTATLPPGVPADRTVHALDDPGLALDEADVAAGRALSIACMACHGAGFSATGAPGPDLRESTIALHLDSFTATVRAGNMARGMPAFGWIDDDQARQLHAYIRARAREALELRDAAGREDADAAGVPGNTPAAADYGEQ